MDLTYPPEADAYRAKVKAFLAENLPADWRGVGALPDDEVEAFNQRWRDILYRNGYLAVNWPKEYGGGGLSPLESVIVAEEFAVAGVPSGSPNDGFGIGLLGNTLLRWGTEEQKHFYLSRILSGEHKWCQGYSEPNAGSDLGNLGLRAVLDGDVWVLNGQKIWTTAGRTADHIFALCRTDPDAPKHKGISFLLCDIDQPGVEVRPIKMMSGESEFCEVFFTDATVPKDNVVGGVNNGWAVAMTLLGHERGGAAATNHIGFKVEFDKLVALAKQTGRNTDPTIRQRIAKVHSDLEVMRFLGLRTLTDFLAGRHPGPEASLSKLVWSDYHRRVTELAVDILGPAALIPEGQRPRSALRHDVSGSPNDSANWLGVFYVARAGTIYAGSNEVQRGVVGEQVLGLPKEPRADGGPWNQIPGHA
ncbi:MAG: acyl-CoA dehydrogenase family protein [Acidimicrobiia bacterium]